MSKVLIIGAGGVGTVVAHKVAQNHDVFTEIVIASRTKSKCDALAADILKREKVKVETDQVDADQVPEIVKVLKKHKTL
jgi:saccharopine dehydrogenase (NAD+, L-lysine-forming)